MASTTRVKIGDEVCITLSVRELREAQQNFGGYQDEMESVCSFQQRECCTKCYLKIIKSKCLLYYSVRLKTFQLVLVFC